ncbi:MAG: hypothetical protein HQL00_06225, partial [Nitrospirae bacterium]|nr:hypothetical protein [Nitrospirota bacterium]
GTFFMTAFGTFYHGRRQLLAYIKYQTKYSYSLLDLSRILAEALFERFSLIDILSFKNYYASKFRDHISQPSLF